MQWRDRVFLLVVVVACLVGFYRLDPLGPSMPAIKPSFSTYAVNPKLPDFSEVADVKEKKEAFFGFLVPLIELENQRIAELRSHIIELSQQLESLNAKQLQWLLKLAKHYRIVASDSPTNELDLDWMVDKLLLRVDQVPPSLALAQAANESAWGTSRFAQDGNNLFGLWCFKKGCGLVPENRPEGKRYEVASFSSPLHSVVRYIHNLNTHFAYQDFRNLRAEHREQNQALTGKSTAKTLERYSTRGEDYIEELLAMIRVNELDRFDTL